MVYPELAGRVEANVALDRDGNIWAAAMHWKDVSRLFCSTDGGRTWTSKILTPTKERHLVAFTVLHNGNMILVTANKKIDDRAEILISRDQGKTDLAAHKGHQVFNR